MRTLERLFVVGLMLALASCAVFSTTQTTKATTENLAQVFENGDNWVMINSEMSYLYDACLYFHLDVQSAVQMSFFTCGAQWETFYDRDAIDFCLYVDGNMITFEEVNYSGTPDIGYAFNTTMPYATVMDAGDHYFRVACAPLSYEAMLYVWNIYVLAVPTTIETGGVSQIIAGENIDISPDNGLGIVTINSTDGGDSSDVGTMVSLSIMFGLMGGVCGGIAVYKKRKSSYL